MSKKVGFVLTALFALFLGYNLVTQIFTTLKSGDKLDSASRDLSDLELKNRQLKEQLSQVKSPQFVEKEARDKLGLAKEGETIVVIPENKLAQVLGETETEAQKNRVPNWLGWWRVFN